MPVDLAPQNAQTYVIKLGSLCDSLSAWMTGRLAEGAGGCASVTLPATKETYLVLTEAAAHRFEWRARHLKGSIQQLPGDPRVQWIRPLTRQLQRLLGWGDVLSTKEDVARACEAGDAAELKALLPQAAALIDREDLDQLPMLHDALRSNEPAPLTDCQHVFFEGVGQGPCPKGLRHCRAPFTRCSSCGMVACHRCADDVLDEQKNRQEEHKEKQRVLHELSGHDWPEEPTKHAECTKCGALRAFVCSCGAQRCARCQRRFQSPPPNPFAPTCVWQQHPTRPLPFYVTDQQRMPEADKLAWMRQELQEGALLPDFAMKFVELFGEKLRGHVPQKSACLKLYAAYAEEGRAWKKESDLAPKLLVAFQRVWDPAAPDRCAECAKALERPGRFCGSACEYVNTKITCRGCGAELDSVHPYCRSCKRGASPLRPANNKRLRDQAAQMAMAQRLLFGGEVSKDPAHVPAWKRRRRS